MSDQLTIFDLDHTLFKVNCSYMFARFLTKKGVYPYSAPLTFLKYKWLFRFRFITLKQLYHEIHNRFVRGLELERLIHLAGEYYELELHKLIHPVVLKRFYEVKKEGHQTLLLSSSPQYLVELIGSRLGFHSSVGTQYAIGADGKIKDLAHIIDGEGKATYLRSLGLPKEALTAYSDSYEDLPLLELVGRPVAVNPDKRLKKHFLEREWEIL